MQCNIGIYISKAYLEKLNITIGSIIKLQFQYGIIEANIYIDVSMEDEYFAISPQISNVEKFFGGFNDMGFIPGGIAIY